MAYTLDDLGTTMVNQLYDIVCGGDRWVPPVEEAFLTWCRPGLPVQPAANTFALTRLVDFVPEVGAAYTACTGGRERARLSTVYGEILRRSRVVHGGLDGEQRRKIENLRDLLRSTSRRPEPTPGEGVRNLTDDGPMLKAYNDKLAAYLAAALRYNAMRVAGWAGAEPGLYRADVQAAVDAWVSVGYRDEVDQIEANIESLTSRDLVRWRQSLIELYDGGLVCASGEHRCYHTTLIPAGFAAGTGWTSYRVGHDSVDRRTHSTSTTWKAGGGVEFGLASVAGQSDRYGGGLATESFALSFDLCRVLISRPWFYPPFLSHRGWTLPAGGDGSVLDRPPSDGGDPPSGSLIGYPTAVLLARDVRIESAEFSFAYSQYAGEVGRGSRVAWGPLSLCGGAADPRGVTVPGMQIIGFVNHLLGMTPDPLPELEPERFV